MARRKEADIQQNINNQVAERNRIEDEWTNAQKTLANDPAGLAEAKRQRDQKISAVEQMIGSFEQEKQGFNPDGSPMAPEFETLIDPATGKLANQYQYQAQTLDPNSLVGYNMIKNMATQKGPSEWAQSANELANLNKQNAMDAASRQGAGALSQMRSNLGMRGGVSSGSQERLAGQSMRDILAQKQGAYRQNASDLLGISQKDAEIKNQMLGQFAGMEGEIQKGNLGALNQASQYNLQNLLKEKDMQRMKTQEDYKSNLDKWASNKQAEATAKAGSGGGGK